MDQSRSTMSLTSPVSCAPNAFLFLSRPFLYIYCRQMNQIRLMTSLTNLGLTLDHLVHTVFALFICVLTNPLLVAWGLKFLHQQ